jgi:hypothetical protein
MARNAARFGMIGRSGLHSTLAEKSQKGHAFHSKGTILGLGAITFYPGGES